MKIVILAVLLTVFALPTYSQGIPMLEYHHIVDETSQLEPSDTVVSIKTFSQQMKWLHENGYITITAAQLAEYMQDPDSLNLKAHDKIIVITFDDGWLDQLNALPILSEYKFKATFNVIASVPGTNPLYMDWVHIVKLSNASYDIGSHTMTHPEQMTVDMMKMEIKNSKTVIEQYIKRPVKTIAWPNGYFTRDMIKETMSVGFIGAQTIDQNWCQYNNTSLQDTLSCQWLTGNRAFQNSFLMKRIFIDGRCNIDAFSQIIALGHTIDCNDNNTNKKREN